MRMDVVKVMPSRRIAMLRFRHCTGLSLKYTSRALGS
jgi:hypothetical protein